MEWSEVLEKKTIYLNLGGGTYCHPLDGYQNYIAVDINLSGDGWAVKHDIRNPFPLPDNSVTRIHCEDFLEHITREEIELLLEECFRLLKPGCRMRIGVPDYNNPKDSLFLQQGRDTRYPLHITLTRYSLMRDIIEQSSFQRYEFYHYWQEGIFVAKDIDYSLGYVRRTPDNDIRCHASGLKQKIVVGCRDLFHKLVHGFSVTEETLAALPGHRLHVTSLVVDLFKPGNGG